MKALVSSALTIWMATASAALASDLTIRGLVKFDQTQSTQANLSLNGLNDEVEIELEVDFGSNPTRSGWTLPNRTITTYSVADYELKIGGITAANNVRLPGCRFEFGVTNAGNAADSLNLLCFTSFAGVNDFKAMNTLRLTMQYPQGTLTARMVQTPDTLAKPDLYASTDDGGLVRAYDFQMYNTGGPSATASMVTELGLQ